MQKHIQYTLLHYVAYQLASRLQLRMMMFLQVYFKIEFQDRGVMLEQHEREKIIPVQLNSQLSYFSPS